MPAKKKTSSGTGAKSKKTVRGKMGKVMHEYKHHELTSGRSGKKVKNPKQAIAIGLSEARRAGANVPAKPGKKKATKKKAASKKTATKKKAAKKSTKKAASKKR